MDTWIAATLAAVAFQTLRFALQKRLKSAGLSSAGATWARFVWSAPILLAGGLGWLAVSGAELPRLSARFWAYALSGGIAQILATICVLALFSRRNFAVGITLKKSEVLMTALVGWLLLGEPVSRAGLAALLLGAVALVVLSKEAGGSSLPRRCSASPAGSSLRWRASVIAGRCSRSGRGRSAQMRCWR